MARLSARTSEWAAFRAVALIFILSISAQIFAAQTTDSSDEFGGIWLRDIQRVRIGQQDAIWIWIGRPLGQTQTLQMDVDIYRDAPADRFVLLTGQWAGAEHMDEFAQAMRKALEPAGWKLEIANLSALGRESGRRILILPSGAWPKSMMQRWNEQVGPNDSVVYFGVRQNQVLEQNGSVVFGGVRAELLAEGAGVDLQSGGERLQTANGPEVWRVGRTLNEFERLDLLSEEIVEYTVGLAGGEKPQTTRISLGGQDRTLAVQNSRYDSSVDAYARIILRNSTDGIKRIWDVRVPGAVGELDGPARVQIGKTAAFQVRLAPEYRQSERISYRAVIYSPNQSRTHEQTLGEQTVGPKEAWLGSFTYGAWQYGGDWRVSIEDQFGRTYASALVSVIEYRLNLLEPLAGSVRLQVLRNGQVMNNEEVRIRTSASEEWKTVRLRNGVLEFGVERGGAAEIEVEVDTVVLHQKLSGVSEDAWSGPLRFGVIALILAAIIIVAIRPRSRAIYRIHLPERPSASGQRVQLSPQQLIDVLYEGVKRTHGRNANKMWVMRAEDAVELLHNSKADDKSLTTSLEDTAEALDELTGRNMLGRWREWYGPLNKGDDERDIRRRAMMHQLYDRLLEAGVRPENLGKKTNKSWMGYCGRHAQNWILFEPATWKTQLCGRNIPNALVFADNNERQLFENELLAECGKWADRLRLAVQTQRMKLVTIEEMKK